MRTYLSNPMQNNSSQSQPTPASATSRKLSGPAETLLVVDDGPMVRDLEAQILRLNGYRVLQAQGAAEALRLAGETEKIHLLITDFSMPEIDGLELSRRFRVVHPKTPVLMVSGSLPLLRDGTRDLDRVELLAKPFAFSELLQRVRTLLDAAQAITRREPWCCD
jgi:two-component system, cell cycle sensor histidine kinase and response regulator CckA